MGEYRLPFSLPSSLEIEKAFTALVLRHHNLFQWCSAPFANIIPFPLNAKFKDGVDIQVLFDSTDIDQPHMRGKALEKAWQRILGQYQSKLKEEGIDEAAPQVAWWSIVSHALILFANHIPGVINAFKHQKQKEWQDWCLQFCHLNTHSAVIQAGKTSEL